VSGSYAPHGRALLVAPTLESRAALGAHKREITRLPYRVGRESRGTQRTPRGFWRVDRVGAWTTPGRPPRGPPAASVFSSGKPALRSRLDPWEVNGRYCLFERLRPRTAG